MVTIKRILCPVDMSDLSQDALRHALTLAAWYEAQVTVLHVYSPPQPLGPVSGIPAAVPLPPTATPEEVAGHLREFTAGLIEGSTVSVDFALREGNASREIVAEAERLPADLLVLGTHGRSGFERLFLGSVTEKVLRTTRVPVMTVPPPVIVPTGALFKTILCPVEFSEASTRAVEYALSLAQEADARLILLHVVEGLIGEGGAERMGHMSVSEYVTRREADAAQRLEALVPDQAREWSSPDVRVTKGRAHAEILKTATEEGAELIVMGVRGSGALNRLLFGSTTHHVIREARCPVLTLHE